MIEQKIKVEGELPDYEKILSGFIGKSLELIKVRMVERSRETKSGRTYGKGRRSSAEGESPAEQSGATNRAYQIAQKSALEGMLINNLGYPALLETGTKYIKPRPLWESTVDEMIPTLENELVKAMS